MTSGTWIQQSLAQLEAMEQQRAARVEALRTELDLRAREAHTREIARLEAGIRELYQRLAAVAEEDGPLADELPIAARPDRTRIELLAGLVLGLALVALFVLVKAG